MTIKGDCTKLMDKIVMKKTITCLNLHEAVCCIYNNHLSTTIYFPEILNSVTQWSVFFIHGEWFFIDSNAFEKWTKSIQI